MRVGSFGGLRTRVGDLPVTSGGFKQLPAKRLPIGTKIGKVPIANLLGHSLHPKIMLDYRNTFSILFYVKRNGPSRNAIFRHARSRSMRRAHSSTRLSVPPHFGRREAHAAASRTARARRSTRARAHPQPARRCYETCSPATPVSRAHVKEPLNFGRGVPKRCSPSQRNNARSAMVV